MTSVKSSWVGTAANPTILADISFEASMHREIAEIAVVAGEQRPFLVVLFGPDGLSYGRIPAVRADDDRGTFDDVAAVFGAAFYADDDAIFDKDLLNRKAFPYLRTGLRCGIDKQFVEHRAPWTVSDRKGLCARRPRNRKWSEVDMHRCRWAGTPWPAA